MRLVIQATALPISQNMLPRLRKPIGCMMGLALKFKPASKRVRVIYGDGEYLSGMDHVVSNPGKVFAVIGPFDSHTDKAELQDMLQTLLRGFNLEEA